MLPLLLLHVHHPGKTPTYQPARLVITIHKTLGFLCPLPSPVPSSTPHLLVSFSRGIKLTSHRYRQNSIYDTFLNTAPCNLSIVTCLSSRWTGRHSSRKWPYGMHQIKPETPFHINGLQLHLLTSCNYQVAGDNSRKYINVSLSPPRTWLSGVSSRCRLPDWRQPSVQAVNHAF